MGDGWGALGQKEPQGPRQLQEAQGVSETEAESTSGFHSKLPLMAARVVSGVLGGEADVELIITAQRKGRELEVRSISKPSTPASTALSWVLQPWFWPDWGGIRPPRNKQSSLVMGETSEALCLHLPALAPTDPTHFQS